jgi:hypothetical protein
MRFFVAFLWRRHVLPTLATPPPCARPAQRGNRLFSRAPCSSAHNKIRYVMSPRNRARVAGQQVGTFRALAFAARLRFSGDSENSVDARICRVYADPSCTALVCGIVEGRSQPSASRFALCGETASGTTASLLRWLSASGICWPSILCCSHCSPDLPSSTAGVLVTRWPLRFCIDVHHLALAGQYAHPHAGRDSSENRAPLPAQLRPLPHITSLCATVSVSLPAEIFPLPSFGQRVLLLHANGPQKNRPLPCTALKIKSRDYDLRHSPSPIQD